MTLEMMMNDSKNAFLGGSENKEFYLPNTLLQYSLNSKHSNNINQDFSNDHKLNSSHNYIKRRTDKYIEQLYNKFIINDSDDRHNTYYNSSINDFLKDNIIKMYNTVKTRGLKKALLNYIDNKFIFYILYSDICNILCNIEINNSVELSNLLTNLYLIYSYDKQLLCNINVELLCKIDNDLITKILLSNNQIFLNFSSNIKNTQDTINLLDLNFITYLRYINSRFKPRHINIRLGNNYLIVYHILNNIDVYLDKFIDCKTVSNTIEILIKCMYYKLREDINCLDMDSKLNNNYFIRNMNAVRVLQIFNKLNLKLNPVFLLIENIKYTAILKDVLCNIYDIENLIITGVIPKYTKKNLFARIFRNYVNSINSLVNYNNGEYYKIYSEYELRYYNKIFKSINEYVDKNDYSDQNKVVMADVDNINNYNIKVDDNMIIQQISNIFKINYSNFSEFSQLHNDIKIGLLLLSDYINFNDLKYYIKNELLELRQLVLNILQRSDLYAKPIFYKYTFKNILSEYMTDYKQLGLIKFYCLENIFGYRVDKLDKTSIEDQINKYVSQKTIDFGPKQVEFFDRYFDQYIHDTTIQNLNYFSKHPTNMSLVDIVNKNQSSMGDYQMELGEAYELFSAQGRAQGKSFMTEDKTVRLNKRRYFILNNDTEQLKINSNYNNSLEHDIVDNVLIKREYIKQRIIVNTDIYTYIPLCKIVKIFSKVFSGMNTCYGLANNKDKSQLYNYINKFIKNNLRTKEFVIMPLDYSNFDTTISIDLIIQCMRKFASITKYKNELLHEINLFESTTKRTYLYQKDFNIKLKYTSSMLSGWKITNIIESMINSVISYGVFKQIDIDLRFLITMGDDIISISRLINKNKEELSVILEKVSIQYSLIGFEVNKSKNSIQYYTCEFLRIFSTVNKVQGYPLRAITSLYFQKPTSEIEFYNYSEQLTNIKLFLCRNEICSKESKVIKYYFGKSKNSNVRQYGIKYYMNKEKYKLESSLEIDKKSFIEISNKEIKNLQYYNIFKFLLGDFVTLIDESKLIQMFKRNILNNNKSRETIIENNMLQHDHTNSNVNIIVNYLLNNLVDTGIHTNLDIKAFTICDYNISKILVFIIQHSKVKDINTLRNYLNIVVQNAFKLHMINIEEYNNNIKLLTTLTMKKQFEYILSDFKLSISYEYYDTMKAKYIKNKIKQFMLYELIYEKRNLSFSRSEIDQIYSRVLGIMLGYFITYFDRGIDLVEYSI